MDQIIELPAEANPLNERNLYHVLSSASSNDPQQIRTGTKQLQQWETERGYYSLLQTVFIDKSLPLEVRYLAIIQLKNGIDKYWRKTATNAVSREDRALIRSRLLKSGVIESDQRLALQNALVIAKIVRFEFPNDWPDVITQILTLIRSSVSNNVHLSRSLQILLQVIKELATGRLQRTRASLQSVTPEIFSVLVRVYLEAVQRWQSSLGHGGGERDIVEDLQQSLLAIKVLRRLIIAGYEFPNRDQTVKQFWNVVATHTQQLLAIVLPDLQSVKHIESAAISYSLLSLPRGIQLFVEKHLMQYAKLHLEMAKSHPAAFVFLETEEDSSLALLGIVRLYWSLIVKLGETFGLAAPVPSAKIGTDGDAEENEKPIIERLSLKGLLLVRACLKMVFNPAQTFKYRHPEERAEKDKAKEIVKTQVFTPSFVQQIMETIVSRFFVFRASDLREWEEEPEEWEQRENSDGEDYEFSIRPCAEKLFLDLLINYKDLLVQPLLNVFPTVASPDNTNVLYKDSVYTAIGLGAAVLAPQLDFDTFLTTTLVADIQKDAPGYNILRRRIAILLGQWISIKVSDENRKVVYMIFQHLLDKDHPLNDQVVCVTAGRQLKRVADDWEFKAENFLPYAPDTLSRLMALIEGVELTETKMALLDTISVIVERMEHHISPYADRIVNLLPPLWTQSGEEHLMKQAILTILTRLINSMKAESRPYHSLVIPIIKGAVEPGSDTQLYLLEDALELWSSILVQTPSRSATEDIISLVPYLLHALTLGSDSLRRTLEIIESYVLLVPLHILGDEIRPQLLSSLANLMGNLKAEANGVVTHLVEVLVRSADELDGERGVGVLVKDMVETGFLKKLVLGLRSSWEAHQTTGPLRAETVVDGVVETDYFAVLARIAISSTQVLLLGISSTASDGDLASTMKWLLEEWFSHFENIGDPPRRKLMCLALTKLLETNQPWILSKLQDLMTIWTDVAVELTEGNEDKTVDSLVYWEIPGLNATPDAPEAPEDERRRRLLYSDPVHRVNLIEYIRHYLQQAIAACGGQDNFQNEWLINVDKDVVAAFGGLGIL